LGNIVGAVEFLALVLLPGAWIACGLPVCSLPFSAKLIIGALLSPLVLIVQFYVARLLGVPFELTPPLLALVNLPALLLIVRRLGLRPGWPNWRVALGWSLILLVPLACLAPTLLNPETRIYTGHAWMYSDPIYLYARGDLVLEDPELAGLRLAYPWFGLLYQGLLSYVLQSPPAASYIWTNIVGLVFIAGLCAALVSELGGSRFAQVASFVWLLFGVNFAGSVLEPLSRHLPHLGSIAFGDYRYSAWYLKFYFFQQEPVALGMLLAIVYVLVRRWPGGFSWGPLLLLGCLTCDLAIVYPILIPAAAAVIGAKVVVELFDHLRGCPALPISQILGVGVVLVVGGLVTLANTRFLTVDVVAPTVRLAPAGSMLSKAGAGLIALSPLLAGLAIVARTRWRTLHKTILVLGLGALGSYFLYVVFLLPGYGAEYKFILTAAVCLAPFPGLAMEPLWPRLGRKAAPALTVLTLILATPLIHSVRQDWPWYPSQGLERTPPLMNLNGFDLRLDDGEPLSGLVDAVRRDTPTDTLLIAARADLHLPTLTARSMYAPPAQQLPHPGVNINSLFMIEESKGYSEALLDGRESTLQALYESTDSSQRQQALDTIRALKRPLAIVVEDDRDAGLQAWLSSLPEGRVDYTGGGRTLWLLPVTGGSS
jgi:hypothetical protein